MRLTYLIAIIIFGAVISFTTIMHQQHRHTNEIENLYRHAVAYGHSGDVYNAVKLCKLIVKKSPDWSAPYAYLSNIYKSRNEWLPALYYSLKAIEHNPFNETTWGNMALAATALEKWETARHAWNQLGFHFKESSEEPNLDLGLIPVRLNPNSQPEIVEAKRIDPARAIILNIPQPSSGRRHMDIVLLDNKPNKNFVLNGQKLAVYDELEVLKSSLWQTYAVMLETSSTADVGILANLCQTANLGFDNWSNASRFFQSNLHPKVVEYYDSSVFVKPVQAFFLVAIAAKNEKEILTVLKNWEIITLQKFSGLECLC